MISLEAESRAGCLVVFSIVAGAVIGVAAAASVIPVDAFFFGTLLGSMIGLIVSPIIVCSLFRKPLPLATTIVFVPSLAAAILAGQTHNPIATLISVLVFCTAAGLCWALLPDTMEWARERPGCPHCGYDTSGLTTCPECGAPVDEVAPQ